MHFVIIHVLLLLVQRDDSQIQTNFFICHRISVTHELFEISDVPCNVAKLFMECLPNFLCTMFFTFRKCQIVFSGTSSITSWQWQAIGFAKTVNDGFQFLPASFRSEISWGQWMFAGAQAASSVNVPLFVSSFKASLSPDFSEDGGVLLSSSLWARRYSFTSINISAEMRLQKSTSVLASNGASS